MIKPMFTAVEPVGSDRISIEEFVEHVSCAIDVHDHDSLASAASAFTKLANDPELVTRHINKKIAALYSRTPIPNLGPQSINLGSGKDFYVRANIWTPFQANSSFSALEERLYSYRLAHDHNFTFMTVGYFGDGYETDLYVYDASRVEGFVGESVDLEFVGRTSLPRGKTMIYREKCDIHVQHPPKELSISLNVIVIGECAQTQDQYLFDVAQKSIAELPNFATVHKRASVVHLAGSLAGPETLDILGALASSAPCRRIRQAAIHAVADICWLEDDEKARTLRRAADDSDSTVRQAARDLLSQLDLSEPVHPRPL